ncbi:venom protease-like [Rhopalosiphum maidis]|uniref:venom protease-like n=1 Tax=Rhopalosiphum maidis TaxID=43146 RepID=UPI000EFE84E5|nr:venom protease-like [Rhopalosiphum maidis]
MGIPRSRFSRLSDLNSDPTIDDGATSLDVPIERIIKHKEHNKRALINDIALVVLKNNIHFTKLIQPIYLPLSQDTKIIDIASNLPFTVGWGKTELEEVQVLIMSTRECAKLYSKASRAVIDDRVIYVLEKKEKTHIKYLVISLF